METIKGTVVKVTEQHIVLLTMDGRFKNVPRSTSEVPLIGQSFTHIEKPKRIFPIYKVASAAAALFLMIVTYFIFPFSGEGEEVYIISLDINPSFEIATNSNFKVVRAEGLNEEGLEIIEALHWNDNLYTVIDEIIDLTVEAGYIEKHIEPVVVTSVIPLKETSEPFIDELKEAIDTSLEKNETTVPVSISLDEKQTYEEAKQSNMSVNYYKEFKQLEKRGIVQNPSEIKGRSISELKRMEKQPERAKERSQSSNGQSKKNGAPPKDDKQNKPSNEHQEDKKDQNEGRSSENKGNAPSERGKPSENKGNAPNHRGKSSENKGNVPSERGKPAENRGNAPSERGKPSETKGNSSSNPGKQQKEIKGPPSPPPGQQKREERSNTPKQPPGQQNRNNN
ncbi:anti-sigma factor domain-containing protein [Alkalihalobacterium sp. APHAB7]|uniref:anti-sigma-I factor RsgI family protein n=1 Tax=Alkalihalobacterium sp. APHAB7 TaxID=3402081 RepID=UPI003AB01C3F